MAPLLLQVEHHIRQAFGAYAVPQSALAQRKVLAVRAARLAIAKENCPCSPRAADRWFLPAVHVPRSHNSLCPRPAHACFSGDPVAAAVLWADGATAQNLPRRRCAFCQFACLVEIEIAWVKHLLPLLRNKDPMGAYILSGTTRATIK